MLIRDCEYCTYLMYLPHLALPLAASLMVIPLEQEATNNKRVTARMEISDFFILVGFSLKNGFEKERFFHNVVVKN